MERQLRAVREEVEPTVLIARDAVVAEQPRALQPRDRHGALHKPQVRPEPRGTARLAERPPTGRVRAWRRAAVDRATAAHLLDAAQCAPSPRRRRHRRARARIAEDGAPHRRAPLCHREGLRGLEARRGRAVAEELVRARNLVVEGSALRRQSEGLSKELSARGRLAQLIPRAGGKRVSLGSAAIEPDRNVECGGRLSLTPRRIERDTQVLGDRAARRELKTRSVVAGRLAVPCQGRQGCSEVEPRLGLLFGRVAQLLQQRVLGPCEQRRVRAAATGSVELDRRHRQGAMRTVQQCSPS